jgi:hypothetical protein
VLGYLKLTNNITAHTIHAAHPGGTP